MFHNIVSVIHIHRVSVLLNLCCWSGFSVLFFVLNSSVKSDAPKFLSREVQISTNPN